MPLEFCWEHRNCTKTDCRVRETGTIFCWRLARVERLCHPDNCAACTYKANWLAGKYDLQAFIASNDRRAGQRYVTRVLAIDDEPNFLAVLEDSITDEGYRCMSAVDGEEGLFFARETLPDIILVDNMAPEAVREAVALVGELSGGAIEVEVSGGVYLGNVAQYAACGVDYIAVGAVTHSAPALDIGLDVEAHPRPEAT